MTTPSPAPAAPGDVMNGYSCTHTYGVYAQPTTSDSPQPDPAPPTPVPTTTPVWGWVGEDCVATSYAHAQPVPTVGTSGSDDATTAEIHGFRGEFGIALALVLFALGVLVFSTWVRGR